MTDLEQTAERWDSSEWSQGVPRDYWSYHPLIHAYIHATIAPHAIHMLDWLAQSFFEDGPRERALSVCCGLGVGDRQALTSGVCHYLEGFDISPESLKIAREEAEKAGLGSRVHYWVDNANEIALERERYDLAIAFGALHHVAALQHLCQQLRQALKSDSYIFVNEFVGPARFQWTEQQLALVNRVASVLPPDWRRTSWVEPPPLEDVIAADPSEAVCSDQVVSILSEHFEIVDYCEYGGSLLMPLWQHALIPDVFMQDNRVDKQVIIKLMILIDELLVEHDIVPSNYVQLVLRNRSPQPDQTVPKRLSTCSPDRDQWVTQWLPGTVFDASPIPANVDAAPTPWWQLPGKAIDTLSQHGPRTMIASIQEYLRWRIQQSPK